MANLSKKVFITTNTFLAFVDRGHPKHAQAGAYFRYFAENNYYLYSGYSDIIQAYIQVSEKISSSLARDFIRTISLGTVSILYATESDMKATIKTLVNYRSSQLSFIDAQTAVLANRNNISQICTFDYLHPLFGQSAFYLPI